MALSKTAYMFGEHDIYAMLADAAAQQRDAAALQQYAPLAEELAVRSDHKLYQAIAHRAWGVAHRLAGRTVDAEVRLNRALELFEALDTRWQIGRTLFELGEVALSQTKNKTAREHFSRALTAFEEIGALPDATRTREKLAAL
jgi:hypothetical protein